MISQRTLASLAQHLEVQGIDRIEVLLRKYSVQVSFSKSTLLSELLDVLNTIDEHTILLILSEVIRTSKDLRAHAEKKYQFDTRMDDLTQCLLLDGYIIKEDQLVQSDPSIADAAPFEDDLIIALNNSGLPRSQEIISRINASTASFRNSPPDYNAALTNARVALETLAVDIAAEIAIQTSPSPSYNTSKWGEIIGFLKCANYITSEEEKGLAGVYGFISPGAHKPIGITGLSWP
jgi:hypothetical protein